MIINISTRRMRGGLRLSPKKHKEIERKYQEIQKQWNFWWRRAAGGQKETERQSESAIWESSLCLLSRSPLSCSLSVCHAQFIVVVAGDDGRQSQRQICNVHLKHISNTIQQSQRADVQRSWETNKPSSKNTLKTQNKTTVNKNVKQTKLIKQHTLLFELEVFFFQRARNI